MGYGSPPLRPSSHALQAVQTLSMSGGSAGYGDRGALLQSNSPPPLTGSDPSGERWSSMGVVGIMRQSTFLLHANSSTFIAITAAFICPASAFTLSHAIATATLSTSLSSRLQHSLAAGGIHGSPFTSFACLKLSQTAVSHALHLPVFITLSILAKAAIVWWVACAYTGTIASLRTFSLMAPMLWKRILRAYLWLYLLMLGCTSMAILLLLLLAGLVEEWPAWGVLAMAVEVSVGVIYSVIFGHLAVISNLACVVTVVEDYSGCAAIARSVLLMKGKAQVALLLFLATAASMAMVEGLFRYCMVGEVSHAARLWGGVVLLITYSFLWLFDTIVSAAFYFSCKSGYGGRGEKRWRVEQVCVGPTPLRVEEEA